MCSYIRSYSYNIKVIYICTYLYLRRNALQNKSETLKPLPVRKNLVDNRKVKHLLH